MQLPLEKGETKFFSKATFYVAGENRTIGVERMVNYPFPTNLDKDPPLGA